MSIHIDDVNKYDSELDTVIDSLINFLNTTERLGNDIGSFSNEWSSGSGDEAETALCCHTVKSEHTSTFITKLSQEDITNEAIKVAVLYRVGSYNMDIQLDMWFPYKSQRNEIYKKFYEIINEDMLTKDGAPAGLSLTLENYFDTIARYDIVGYNFPDDERSSQEDEWRVKIDLKVHFDKKLQKIEHKITDPIIVDSDSETGEEWISETIIIE